MSMLSGLLGTIQGPDLRRLVKIFDVPNLREYVDGYLDWRDPSKAPFIGPMALGPGPEGCNPYERIIGA